MALNSSSSEPQGARCTPIVEARTQECLEEIRNMSSDEFANVIVLVGRTGVGKSALLEYLTNAQGHSENSINPVTLEFQLERVKLSNKRYYIMDTPGFDTNKELAVFHEIMRGIEAVRSRAKIVGIMLVTRINDNRAEEVDNKLVDFVDKLCGPDYAAQITAVTNFWNVSEPEEQVDFENRLGERLERWRGVLGQELKQYQHGRQYNSKGEDIGVCLKWRGDSDDIKAYGKAMVNRHYGGIHLKDPRIVRELSENQPLGNTAVGKFLGITPPIQSSPPSASSSSPSSSTSSSSSSQPQVPAPLPATSEPGGEEAPSTGQFQSPLQAPSESRGLTFGEVIKGVCRWGWENVAIPVVNEMFNSATTGRAVVRGWPNHLDFKSSKDHFVARGLPGDLGFRTQWAKARGINLEPGSHAFGNAVRDQIMREWPL